MMGGLNLAVALIAGVTIVFGLLYVLTVTFLGVRQTRKDGVPVGKQEALIDVAPDPTLPLGGFEFFFLIPALDEEAVIGGTVNALLQDQAGAQVIVIDDGSTDGTAEIVESFAGTGRVMLLRRTLPHARQGKGRALNAGLELIRQQTALRELPASRVIVAVMDADGRMTPNATAAVAQEFGRDPSVGGLQLVVRIRNRDTTALTFQDMEFWAISAIGQFGRIPFGSVSMGGNGQFTRLAALDEIGSEPWSDSLTEDLDLGISLSALGWTTTSTPRAYVTQQGVPDLRRLLKQRTRWYQGHMMAMRRFPELASSRFLPTGRFLELTAYLALPWCLSLPWPIVQGYVSYSILFGRGGIPAAQVQPLGGRLLVAGIWVLLSFAPNVFWGVVYYRRARHRSLLDSLVMSHGLVLWSYVSYVAAYRALGRILLRRNGWTKTARENEGENGNPASPHDVELVPARASADPPVAGRTREQHG